MKLPKKNIEDKSAHYWKRLRNLKIQNSKEELRKKNQLKLERRLHIETAQRLGVYDSCPSLWVSKTIYDSDDEYEDGYTYDDPIFDEPYVSDDDDDDDDDYVTTPVIPKNNKLQLARNKLRLYNVTIHPCIVKVPKGKTVTGTLETHANGFRYKNYSIPYELDIMFHDLRKAFFQDGDKEMAPLCHLHLHNPIMVGTEMTKDIQFRMVQQTFKGGRNMRRLVRDSDEFKKENQNRKDNSNVIRNFLSRVEPIICSRSSLFHFAEVEKKYGFYGEMVLKEHHNLLANFVFMFSCIVQLEHMPFAVIIFSEIEIVNLVHVRFGIEMFNMTIVFKDFKQDVLQINSIPLRDLICIKQTLDTVDVKYYENKVDIPDWGSILKRILDDPKKFIEEGGWKFLNSGESTYNYSDISKEGIFHPKFSGNNDYSDEEPPHQAYNSASKENEKRKKCETKVKRIKKKRRRQVVVMSDESDGEE